MEKFSPSPEKLNKSFEIMHLRDYDIVLSSDFSIDTDELGEFLDTIDESLVIDEKKFLNEDNEEETEEQGKHYIFETGGHKYFVKQKWYDVRQQKDLWGRRDLERDSTFGSILNEFKLTPIVEEMLSGGALKEKILNAGYEEVKLIPIRAGAVRKSTGQKFLIYDFYQTEEFHDELLEKILTDEIRARGIEPRDLEFNLRCNPENPKQIYLLDIEGYKFLL